MIIILKNSVTPEEVEKKILRRKPVKIISAKKHLGKVKWGQDALDYQKQKRNEWD
jgi:hypothetical protein